MKMRWGATPAASIHAELRSRRRCATVNRVSCRRIHRNARGVAVMRRLVIVDVSKNGLTGNRVVAETNAMHGLRQLELPERPQYGAREMPLVPALDETTSPM